MSKILWKKKCNSCNIKLERYFYHEIMHCSCSVQSLIPDGTDTELCQTENTAVRKGLCTFDLFYQKREKEQSHDTKTEYFI